MINFNKMKYLLILLALVFFACGNPSIKRYLIRVPLSNGPDNNLLKQKSPLKESKKSQAPEEVLKDKMLIYADKNIKVFMSSIDADQLDELAEQLGLYPSQRYYRLPGLTFFKYEISNTGKETVKLNLFDSKFVNQFKRDFSPVMLSAYEKHYTSTSYNRFEYDFIYSYYVVEKEGKKSEDDDFYISKTLPGRTIEVLPTTKGFQIVPYSIFSPGSRTYTLHMPLYDGQRNIKIPFYYRAVRSDREDELKLK